MVLQKAFCAVLLHGRKKAVPRIPAKSRQRHRAVVSAFTSEQADAARFLRKACKYIVTGGATARVRDDAKKRRRERHKVRDDVVCRNSIDASFQA